MTETYRRALRVAGMSIAVASPSAACMVQHADFIEPIPDGETGTADDGVGEGGETGDGEGDDTAETTGSETGSTGAADSDDAEADSGDQAASDDEAGTDGDDDTEGSGREHRVFVTSTIHTGNLGGQAGADSICQTRAQEADLDGSWVALLSTSSTNARDSIVIDGPVLNMQGALVAEDAADLWDGSIQASFRLDEHGDPVGQRGWTGTTAAGLGSGSVCENWTAQTGGTKGTLGRSDGLGGDWVEHDLAACSQSFHLYCLDQ